MRRLLWLALLLWLLAIVPLALAQENEDLPLQYTFIDGTTFNYPVDFSIYDEEDDGVFIANDVTDIYVFTLYERSLASNNITNLPEAIDAFIGDNWDYEPSDAVAMEVGGQEIARFTYYPENSSGNEFERTLYAMYVGENGTIAIVSVIPVNGRDITETERVLQILETVRYVDTSGGGTVLGNAVDLPNAALIEHRDSWQATSLEEGVQINSENTRMSIQVFTPEEVRERGFKTDSIDILYGLFAPFDENIGFDSSRLAFPQLAGREVTRYRFTDVRDGERVEHLFLVFEMDSGLFVFVDIATTDPLYRDEVAIEEMLLTIRMQGEPPPYRLMMQSSYNLQTGATVRFPNNWTVLEGDNDAISINSVESNLFVLIYTEAQAQENGYLDGDLTDSLLAILSPLDESLSFTRDDVFPITLDNGNEAVRLDYRETNDSGVSYDRIVVVQRLQDGSIVFTGLVPQPGLDEITPEMEAVTIAIIGTIRTR